MAEPLSVVALISGRGTNLQAIIDAARDDFPARLVAVISNRPGVAGLERAARAGIPAHTVDHKDYGSRESFEAALRARLAPYAPDLVVLAGFMRILTPEFIAGFADRLLNIHPSLLPRFPGLDTHQRALDAGVREHGASVHFVTPELDAGPVIIQARVPVEPGDDAETLAARVLEQEHRIYVQAIRWFAEDRLRVAGRQVLLDGQPVDLVAG